MKVIRIHTDGACPDVQKKENRVAGWAWIDDESGTRSSGAKADETHIWGEIYAVYAYLKFIKECNFKDVELHITTDSKYVIDGFNKLRSGDILRTHYAVWKRIRLIAQELSISFVTHKVKGHSGDELNDIVDKMAVAAVKKFREELRNK